MGRWRVQGPRPTARRRFLIPERLPNTMESDDLMASTMPVVPATRKLPMNALPKNGLITTALPPGAPLQIRMVHRGLATEKIVAFLFLVTVIGALVTAVGPSAMAQSNRASDSLNATKVSLVSAPDDSTNTAARSSQSIIADLIEKLGHENYASRERAKAELREFGLEALEQLRAAQTHSDIEIAVSSQRLLRSALIDWSDLSDPPSVRLLLRGYGSQSKQQRETLIGRLARLNDVDTTGALARLSRFETDSRLARIAAFELMQSSDQEASQTSTQRADLIEQTVGPSQRDACRWLRLFAGDLRRGSFDLPSWSSLLTVQRRALDRNVPDRLDDELLIQFVQILAVRAADLGERDKAIEFSRANFDLIKPKPDKLIDAATWSLEQGFPELVLDLRKLHPRPFRRTSLLVYSAAEAAVRMGDQAKAEEFAREALAISPIPSSESERAQLSDRELEDRISSHAYAATELRERGFFDWAEREYRHAIESVDITSPIAAIARTQLASMYSDLYRHQEVIDTLAPLLERMKSDDKFQQTLLTRNLTHHQVLAQSSYHQGLLHVENGDSEGAKQAFQQAYNLGGDLQVDVLIAMFRLEGGAEWDLKVRNTVQRKTLDSERRIKLEEDRLRRMGGMGQTSSQLATAFNGYAWLVSNTQGDFAKALQYSEASLRIRPGEAAYLDTLARCHFAMGQLDEAIATQRQAVAVLPNLPPLQRQLDEFLAAQQGEASQSPQKVPNLPAETP